MPPFRVENGFLFEHLDTSEIRPLKKKKIIQTPHSKTPHKTEIEI